jgi:hypothetical protein
MAPRASADASCSSRNRSTTGSPRTAARLRARRTPRIGPRRPACVPAVCLEPLQRMAHRASTRAVRGWTTPKAGPYMYEPRTASATLSVAAPARLPCCAPLASGAPGEGSPPSDGCEWLQSPSDS